MFRVYSRIVLLLVLAVGLGIFARPVSAKGLTCKKDLILFSAIAVGVATSAPAWRQVFPYDSWPGTWLGTPRPQTLIEQRIELGESSQWDQDELELLRWLSAYDLDRTGPGASPTFEVDAPRIVFELLATPYDHNLIFRPNLMLHINSRTRMPQSVAVRPEVFEVASAAQWESFLEPKLDKLTPYFGRELDSSHQHYDEMRAFARVLKEMSTYVYRNAKDIDDGRMKDQLIVYYDFIKLAESRGFRFNWWLERRERIGAGVFLGDEQAIQELALELTRSDDLWGLLWILETALENNLIETNAKKQVMRILGSRLRDTETDPDFKHKILNLSEAYSLGL